MRRQKGDKKQHGEANNTVYTQTRKTVVRLSKTMASSKWNYRW